MERIDFSNSDNYICKNKKPGIDQNGSWTALQGYLTKGIAILKIDKTHFYADLCDWNDKWDMFTKRQAKIICMYLFFFLF